MCSRLRTAGHCSLLLNFLRPLPQDQSRNHREYQSDGKWFHEECDKKIVDRILVESLKTLHFCDLVGDLFRAGTRCARFLDQILGVFVDKVRHELEIYDFPAKCVTSAGYQRNQYADLKCTSERDVA